MIEQFRRFIHRYSLVILLATASAFLRLYNLESSLMFQGDQGRDAMIVADIFRNRDLVFIGPVTSVGNMYLGPLYYYFMLPFLIASYPSPIGPAVGIALLGVITTVLLVSLGKQMVGARAAYIASFLYTFSAVSVLYSRFSWNPNPAPLVGLLLLYTVWKATQNSKYWVWVGVWVAVIIQLHYLTLLAVGSAGLVWLIQLFKVLRIQRQELKNMIKNSVLALIIFLLSLTPLFLFDLKHNWLNTSAFASLISGDTFETRDATLLPKIMTYIKETDGRSRHILFDHGIGNQQALNRVLLGLVVVLMITLTKSKQQPLFRSAFSIILIFIAVTIIGTAMYQHSVFDHYILFILPAVYLLHGKLLDFFFSSRLLKSFLFGILSIYALYNLPKMPLATLGWTVSEIAQVSKSIHERVKPGQPYNIVLVSESKDSDGQNYRYFLTTDRNKKPVTPEMRGTVDMLFIIDEIKNNQAVTNLPLYEIVTFPNKNPSEIYQIPDGPEITVLQRTQ